MSRAVFVAWPCTASSCIAHNGIERLRTTCSCPCETTITAVHNRLAHSASSSRTVRCFCTKCLRVHVCVVFTPETVTISLPSALAVCAADSVGRESIWLCYAMLLQLPTEGSGKAAAGGYLVTCSSAFAARDDGPSVSHPPPRRSG